MQRFSSLLLVVTLAFGLTLVTGCDSGSSSSEGSMSMTMSDGSKSSTVASKAHVGDLQKAEMTVSNVTVVTEDSEEEGVSILDTESFTVDLKKLNAGLTENVNDFSVPAGTYGQVRLKTGEKAVQLTMNDGTKNTARIASNEIKLNFSPAVTVESADDQVEVTVDWNVEESLEGNLTADNLVITPVVQAEATVTSVTEEEEESTN